jgi:hypothetical protein
MRAHILWVVPISIFFLMILYFGGLFVVGGGTIHPILDSVEVGSEGFFKASFLNDLNSDAFVESVRLLDYEDKELCNIPFNKEVLAGDSFTVSSFDCGDWDGMLRYQFLVEVRYSIDGSTDIVSGQLGGRIIQ